MFNLIKSAVAGRPESGRQIIGRVLSSFRAVREDLQQGVALVDAEIADNQSQIDALADTNRILGTDRESALNVIKQIDAIVK